MSQRVQIQYAKLELEQGGEIVMKGNDTRNEKENIFSEDNTEGSDRVISSQEDDSQMLMRQKCKVAEEEEDEHSVVIKKVVNSFLLRYKVGSQSQQVNIRQQRTIVKDEETKSLRMLLWEEVFQVSDQKGKHFKLQANCEFAGLMEDEVRGNEARMSHKGGAVLYLQYAYIALKDKKVSEMYEVEKVRDLKQHNIAEIEDEVFERSQRKVELLKHLLEEPEDGSEIAVGDREMSQTLIGIETYVSFQTHDKFAGRKE